MIKRVWDSRTAADKECPGRPRTAQCEDRIQRVPIDVQENPQTSIRVKCEVTLQTLYMPLNAVCAFPMLGENWANYQL